MIIKISQTVRRLLSVLPRVTVSTWEFCLRTLTVIVFRDKLLTPDCEAMALQYLKIIPLYLSADQSCINSPLSLFTVIDMII